jgi:hypothetical protein
MSDTEIKCITARGARVLVAGILNPGGSVLTLRELLDPAAYLESAGVGLSKDWLTTALGEEALDLPQGVAIAVAFFHAVAKRVVGAVAEGRGLAAGVSGMLVLRPLGGWRSRTDTLRRHVQGGAVAQHNQPPHPIGGKAPLAHIALV